MASTNQREDVKITGKIELFAADDDPNPAIVLDPVTGEISFGSGSSAATVIATLDGGTWNTSGTGRLVLGGVSANTAGSVMQSGTSGTPLVNDTAATAFISCFYDSGATSGDNKGLSVQLNPTGVLQTFSTGIYGNCSPSVQVRNPVGVQGDLIFGTGGWVQGLAYAIGGYASLPNADADNTGNFAGCNIEVAAGGSSTDVSGSTRLSVLRLSVSGDATGIATFEENGAVISLVGFTSASGTTNMISSTSLAELPANVGIKVGIGTGGGGDTFYYIPAVAVAGWN